MKNIYKGYTIKHGIFGWFGIPEKEDVNMDRWGYTPNFNTKIELEAWIDDLTNNTSS